MASLDDVEKAIARLLRASQDFSKAYEDWQKRPVPEARLALAEAERTLDEARMDAWRVGPKDPRRS